jgi:hypothetical protein
VKKEKLYFDEWQRCYPMVFRCPKSRKSTFLGGTKPLSLKKFACFAVEQNAIQSINNQAEHGIVIKS